ncbi:universal stress protein [Boudabousia marimammalium]|uniref:Universal stress protein n=1 Tax=Boudabousia marimammalium TaxID=156892 RepID=A0A1Q5PL95_9ACTO|nr:universal stress protein [Boudabousia marimammalium]OKL47371.1 universal stress protein [Boudabousia marimammalium]
MSADDVIVVGTDGSDGSGCVVNWAIGQAARMGAHLRVLVAYEIPSYSATNVDGSYVNIDDGSLRERAMEIAQGVCDKASKQGVSVDSHVSPGDPASLLLEASKTAAMLVIGTAGSQGFADRLLGAVSAVVPSRSHCPVVVVPRHQEGSPFMPVERIVVGVDGSDNALTALRRSIDVAAMWGARVSAVSTVPFATGNTLLAWMPPIIDRERVTQDIRVGLNVAVEQALDGREVKVARHVLDGNPAELLAEFSTAVDLIVVGNRGRGGFAGLLLGSTSRELLARSTCPVMVVPSHKRDKNSDPAKASPARTPWERA